jgi:hypothetical protein
MRIARESAGGVMTLADKLHDLYLNKEFRKHDYYECLSLLNDLLCDKRKRHQEEAV